MPRFYPDDLNPGEELRKLLRQIFPPTVGSDSFLTRIDHGLMAQGDFSEIVYESCINYLVRRLITSARFIFRPFKPLNDERKASFANFDTAFRKFLTNELRIASQYHERILLLVKASIELKEGAVSTGTKNDLIHESKRGDTCYMCGVDLVFTEQPGSPDSAEIEHRWPQSLGGANQPFNLDMACFRCNKQKKDYIDASDFHYEEICLTTDITEESFSREMSREYELAIWARYDFRCTNCQRPASEVGKLQLIRKSNQDSWHFLNIDAYCDKCARLIVRRR